MEEYLERIFGKSFEREVAREEVVFSSLSFFVATIGLTAGLLAYIASKMPDFNLSIFSLFSYGLVILEGLLIIGLLLSIFAAIRERRYRRPPGELGFLSWADNLKSYYHSIGLTDKALDDAIVGDLRRQMLTDLAQSISENRPQNAKRIAARNTGVTLILVQLALAFVMVGAIFVHDRVSSASIKESVAHAASATFNAPAAGGDQTAAAAAAIHRGRLQNPRGEARSH